MRPETDPKAMPFSTHAELKFSSTATQTVQSKSYNKLHISHIDSFNLQQFISIFKKLLAGLSRGLLFRRTHKFKKIILE